MELLKILESLEDLCSQAASCELEEGETIVLRLQPGLDVKEILERSGLKYKTRGPNGVSIEVQDYPGLFFDREHFLREVVEKRSLLHQDIAILHFTGQASLFYDCDSGKTYLEGKPDESELFLQNTDYYLCFFDYFSTSGMVEYHSRAAREFILVAPEKGKFLLGYPPLPPVFPRGISVKEKYARLERTSASEDFRLYLEMQIIDSLAGLDHDQRFPRLIENIESIVEKSENSYKLFLSRFDFDKFRKGFEQKRDAYFKSMRDVIDGLLSKAVAIPISISAAALAIYNAKEDALYSTVIVVAFVIYSLFTSYLMRLSQGSIFDIEMALDEDVRLIAEKTRIERQEFSREEVKVHRKIRKLTGAVAVMQLLLSGLSLAVLVIYAQPLSMGLFYKILLMAGLLAVQLSIAFAGVRGRSEPVRA